MFKYDSSTRTITFRKIKSNDLKLNVLQDLRDSYKRYCTDIVIQDVKYFFENVLSKDAGKKYTADVYVGDLNSRGYFTITGNKYLFYPVFAIIKMYNEGSRSYSIIGNSDGFEILDIPYMDHMGHLSTRSGEKVCLGVLKPSEDAAYDYETGTYNIAMPNANFHINIKSTDNSRRVYTYSKSTPNTDLDKIIQGMLYNIGDSTDVKDIYVSNYSRSTLSIKDQESIANIANYTNVQHYVRKLSPGATVANDMYKLGKARESLNELYDLRGAIGEYTSRALRRLDGSLICDLNHKITEKDIIECHRNLINVIYVLNKDVDYSGYTLARAYNLRRLPKGIRMSKFLATIFPQYANEDFLPEDVEASSFDEALTTMGDTDPESEEFIESQLLVYLPEGTMLTKDIMDFFLSIPVRSIECKIPESDKTITVSFEREVVGNYMCKLGLLDEHIVESDTKRSYDEWVYTYNNPNFDPTPAEILNHLTAHDLEAVYADICRINEVGTSDNLLNRDDAFLKKLSLIHEQFSKYFRDMVAKRYKTASSAQGYINGLLAEKNLARGLTDSWLFELYKNNVMASLDSLNAIAEVSQLTHANIQLKEPPDKVRHIAMPYYSRICPFETPAGKPLGLVNNRTVGCKIDEDGNILAPYYVIMNSGGRPRVSTSMVWLKPKEELGCKFIDSLSIKVDEKGFILTETMNARVPNPERGEPFIITKIHAKDLIGSTTSRSYIDVFPEQILSVAACMIPFIGSDNSTRITYGLAQMKQTVYLLDSEIPRVMTDMYKDILHYCEYPVTKSPVTGVVQSTRGPAVHTVNVDANGKTEPVSSAGPGSWEYKGIEYSSIYQLVSDGRPVAKGEPLLKHVPVVHPYVTEVHRPMYLGQVRAESASTVEKFDPNDTTMTQLACRVRDPYTFQNSRVYGQTVAVSDINFTYGDHMKAGDLLTTTNMSKGGYYTPSRNALIAYIPCGFNYEDGVAISENASFKYTSLIIHKLRYPIPKNSFYKFWRDHDLKYCKAGDEIGRVYPSSDVSATALEVARIYADSKHEGIFIESRTVTEEKSKDTYIEIYLLGFNKLQTGDKMAGRHGNKGVVSYIYSNSQCYQFLNGLVPDVILNPHGVPSRMNIGQINEIHLGFVSELTDTYSNSNAFNGATNEEITLHYHLIYDFSQWLKFGEVKSAQELSAKIKGTPEYASAGISEEFIQQMWNTKDRVELWIDAFNRDGTAPMYDPISDTYLNTPVTFGYAYYNKLVQEVDEKIAYRSGPLREDYSMTNCQPLKSSTSANGQRSGEMELINLVTYGASGLLKETLNEKSDNRGKSFNLHAAALQYKERIPEKYCKSEAVINLYNYLTALGVNVDFDPDEHIIDPGTYDGFCYGYSAKKVLKIHVEDTIFKHKTLEVTASPEDILEGIASSFDEE